MSLPTLTEESASKEWLPMLSKSKNRIVGAEALIAVSQREERRLRTIVDSDHTSPEEKSRALNDLSQLWRNAALKLADLEE